MEFKIQCRECGCIKQLKDEEVPVGECSFCKENFGYYVCKGRTPVEFEKCFPLQEGDLIVVDTALPNLLPDGSPNFNRIFSIVRNGGILAQKIEVDIK
jgi:hypothetical protein